MYLPQNNGDRKVDKDMSLRFQKKTNPQANNYRVMRSSVKKNYF